MTVKRVSTYGKGRAGLVDALRNREPFVTGGALRGNVPALSYRAPSPGRLCESERKALHDDAAELGLVYVVWSYETPIAWAYNDGEGGVSVHHVSQSFSPTTSKHQGIVRCYL